MKIWSLFLRDKHAKTRPSRFLTSQRLLYFKISPEGSRTIGTAENSVKFLCKCHHIAMEP